MPAWAILILERLGTWCWDTRCWKKIAPFFGYERIHGSNEATDKEQILPKPHE